ncbi:MAG: leucine-rich repeat domain-containing protein, partial [Oscillospiraceae bacterium]|nr:leucine-rich repeat domain-containing protein [Oscillospiraceae bacterium]
MKLTSRRLLALFLAALFVVVLIPTVSMAETTASGTCGADGDNLTWSLSEGVLTISGSGAMADYAKDSTSFAMTLSTAPWDEYKSEIQSVVVEEGVTHIGDYAFFYATNVSELSLPSTLTSVGDYSFYYLGDVEECELPSGLETIGDYAFYWFMWSAVSAANSAGTELPTLSLPDSVTEIGDNAFTYCWALRSVDLSHVTSIGSSAFRNCIYLENAVWSDTITDIPYGIFYGCTALTGFTFPEQVTSIGGYAFYDCSALQDITLPDALTSIGSYAFSQCTSLERIDIPAGVTALSSSVFYGCTALATVTLPEGLESIEMYAFAKCKSLVQIELPSSLTSMGPYVFDSSGLTSVRIPEGVAVLPQSGFTITTLYNIFIPSSVTSIENSCFNDIYGRWDFGYVFFGGSAAQWSAIDIADMNQQIT